MSTAVWIVIVLLILANAFYVAAEFGAVGVRRSRVRRLSEDGNVWARQLLPHVENPGRLDTYVAVSQVGITLSSLILGAVGQGLVAVALGSWITTTFGLEAQVGANTAAIVVLLFLTAAQVVLSELIPKSLALQYPTEVALATVLPMRWSLAAPRSADEPRRPWTCTPTRRSASVWTVPMKPLPMTAAPISLGRLIGMSLDV